MVGRIVVESVRLASCANTAKSNKIAKNAADHLIVSVKYKKCIAPSTGGVNCVSDVSWYAPVLNTTSTVWTVS